MIWVKSAVSKYTKRNLANFLVYQIRNPLDNHEYETKFWKAVSLVQMLDKLPEYKVSLHYKLYFDHLFTNMSLLSHLKEWGYGATGTFWENRISKHCPLSSCKEMKKEKSHI